MGYNEEEKKAIEYLKDVLELANKLSEGELRLMDAEIEAIKTLINEYKTSLKARFELQRRVEKQAKEMEEVNKKHVSKDKIKTILDKQYELWSTPNRQKEYNQELVEVLEELLQEE